MPGARWTKQDTIEIGQRALEKLTNIGVQLRANDRLTRALATVSSEHPTVGEVPGTCAVSREYDEATRTIVEMAFIARHAVARPDVISLIEIALGGADLPESDPADRSKPRDTQAELLVWAMMRAAGIHATLQEPDVRVVTPFGILGIAVKRSSGRSARKLVAKGIQQINLHTKAGFIAVAADLRQTKAQADDPFRAWVEPIIGDLAAQRDVVAASALGPSLVAILFIGTSYRWIDVDGELLNIVTAHFRALPNDPPIIPDADLEPFLRSIAEAFFQSLQSKT